MAKVEQDKKKLIRHLQIIDANIDQALCFLNDIQYYAKSKNSQITLNYMYFSLNKIIMRVFEMFEVTAEL